MTHKTLSSMLVNIFHFYEIYQTLKKGINWCQNKRCKEYMIFIDSMVGNTQTLVLNKLKIRIKRWYYRDYTVV